jgi:hypothetical protein
VNFSKVFAVGMASLGMLPMATKCEDPGDAEGGGKSKRVTVSIKNGTKLTKATYGLWRADDNAPTGCRWKVTNRDGKNIASGGRRDAVIVGRAHVGGTLHATNCGIFWKVWK